MLEIKPKRMLAIFAHPDDESFAVGGTLAKYAHQDVHVILLCATRGQAGISGVKPEEAGDIREGNRRLKSISLTTSWKKSARFNAMPAKILFLCTCNYCRKQI